MSGHSKWAQIKRKKAVTDAKKGAVFTKIVRNIELAAKNGKDPEMNPTLRTAIEQARAVNMPHDNVEKAILKGAGELPGVSYQEILYEGYAPGGVALIIACVTDNPNRTVAEIRHVLGRYGGTLGSSGSVRYMFEQKGIISIANETVHSGMLNDIELLAIDHGAENIEIEKEGMTILVDRDHFHELCHILHEKNITPASAEITWITSTHITPSPDEQQRVHALIESLEELDDVQHIATNLTTLS